MSDRQQQRGFKGVWIPSNIWLAQGLTLQEKVFLVEIDSLDNEQGCFASNDHFSEFFQLSKSRCSEIITNLEKKELITITRTYKENSKEVEKRTLRVNKLHETFTGVPLKEEEGVRKVEDPPSENRKGSSENRTPPFGKPKDNNTLINNTLINNTVYKDVVDVDTLARDVISFFQANIKFALSPIEIQTIEYWVKDYPAELLFEAIKRTSFANSTNPRYTESILADWQRRRFVTLQDVHRFEEAQQQKIQRKGGNPRGTNREDNDPNEQGYKPDMGF